VLPQRLPRLFAVDERLEIKNGFRYQLDCSRSNDETCRVCGRPHLRLLMPKLGSNMPNMGMTKRAKRAPRRESLADALFTTTQQRVLGLLFGQPDRSFYATELIAMTAAGSGAVQRELARLEQTGLVVVSRLGTQKHYQANPDSPLFAELCGIVRKTVGLAEPLRETLAPLASGIAAAFVYGSVAKGGDSATSDIDLMVVSDSLTYADVFAALTVWRRQAGSTPV